LGKNTSVIVVAASVPEKTIVTYFRVVTLGFSFTFNFKDFNAFMLCMGVSLAVVEVV